LTIERNTVGRLDGKVAIVTGGASGIGKASVELFAREGASIILADIQDEAGNIVASQCRDAGGAVVFHHADVTKEADIEGSVRRAVEEFGGLNVMYNNAGYGGPLGIEGVPADDWDRAHAQVLRPVFLGIKHAAPVLRKAGGGSIISTSSDSGMRATPPLVAYSTFKAGVVMLTQNAAVMLGPDRIRVNCITPGWMLTPALMRGYPDEQTTRTVAAKAQPIPRCGEATDIAEAALFLASDASAFITGVALPVDGGWWAQANQTAAVTTALTSMGQSRPSHV
jgi:NAD(P)-dependent dehydrogenase (short-subunit alcohol dehydrogenase family)